MDKEQLKRQLSDSLLAISKTCVAGALAVAGFTVVGQTSSADAAIVGDAAGSVAIGSASVAASDDAAILLRIAEPQAGDQLAGHYSHSSHASHASHVSHYSSRP